MALLRLVARVGIAASLALPLGLAAATAGAGGSTAKAAKAGSPYDGRIVFNDFQTGQIYTVNPDGSALEQVTHFHGAQVAFQAEWGPHSKHIIFTSNMAGDFRLYLMRADGTHRRQLAPERAGYQDFQPTITPNGRRVVYARCAPDPPGGCSIYSIRTDGGGRRHALTHTQGDSFDFASAVSPNGQQISFLRGNYRGIIAQVWLMRSDGTHAHPITPPRLEAETPSWTPDGRQVLFTSDAAHLGSSVYSIGTDGTHLTRLTDTQFPHNDVWQSMAPGGDRIVFTSDRKQPDLCCRELYVMRSDGSRQHIIVRQPQGTSDPDWGSAPLQTASSASRLPVTTTPMSPARAQAVRAAERQAQAWAPGGPSLGSRPVLK